MWCQSCKAEYDEDEAGTCKECYEEASETEEELKREIADLRSALQFLRLPQPYSFAADLLLLPIPTPPTSAPSSSPSVDTVAIPAHRAVLACRSPVFKAMLENEMEESRSGVIKIHDVSSDVLRSFVGYLYTAEVHLDEQVAKSLLVLAEKYQVSHLKACCERFLTSRVNSENALSHFVFAHLHNARQLQKATLSVIIDGVATLVQRQEYKELLDTDPRLVVEIFEAYLARQVNIADQ